MPDFIDRPEAQDPSEAFDEDNFDPLDGGVEQNKFRTFEDIPEVEDFTRSEGDGGGSRFGAEGKTSTWRAEVDAADILDEPDSQTGGRDEVELVFDGLLENTRGAQASAAHWEARSLSDDDIDALGYGPEPTERA